MRLLNQNLPGAHVGTLGLGCSPSAGPAAQLQGPSEGLWGLASPSGEQGCPSLLFRAWGEGCLAEHLLLAGRDDANEPSINFCCPLTINSQAKESISRTINKGTVVLGIQMFH